MPRFDSPSIFGSLLDRGAGSFRLAPFGIHHPTDRSYEPGTNVMVTTWKTPTGWLVVRDALTMGPGDREDVVTAHTRPPADLDAEHVLVRTAECLEGRVAIDLVCEPVFDYGRSAAEWQLVEGDRHTADATGGGQTVRLRSDLALGIEHDRARARHVLAAGERAFCALSWSDGLTVPEDQEQAEASIFTTARYWRGWLGRGHPRDPHGLHHQGQLSTELRGRGVLHWRLVHDRDRLHYRRELCGKRGRGSVLQWRVYDPDPLRNSGQHGGRLWRRPV